MDQKTYGEIVNFLRDGTYPPTESLTGKKKWNFRRKVSMHSVSESKKLFKVFIYSTKSKSLIVEKNLL